jgi:cellobiose dehydrogenase (acceptor)
MPTVSKDRRCLKPELYSHYIPPAVTIGTVFPTSTTGTEFIGEIVAPISVKWAAIALGGAMIGNPLLMAWPYGSTIVTSTRWATDYNQPECVLEF